MEGFKNPQAKEKVVNKRNLEVAVEINIEKTEPFLYAKFHRI